MKKPTERLLELAHELVGKTETAPNRSPEIDELKKLLHGGTDSLAYCVDTVRGLAKKVDLELGTANILHDTRSARSLYNLTLKPARLTLPVPGCAVIWGFYDKEGAPTAQGHCGIVMEVLGEGRIKTFEGNTQAQKGDAAHDREGDGFYIRDRASFARQGPMRLLGFLKIWL